MDCVSDYSVASCFSHMMTKLKLNVYRAEDEFIIMQRLQWRKEEEESKKERRKVGWEVVGGGRKEAISGGERDGCTEGPAEQRVEGEERGGEEEGGEERKTEEER